MADPHHAAPRGHAFLRSARPRRVWTVPFATLLALVLGLAAAPPAGAFVQRAPSDFFGINGQELRPLAFGTPDQQAKLESQLSSLQQTGVGWVRASMPWSQVEPAAPVLGSHVYDWTASDAWVQALARHGGF